MIKLNANMSSDVSYDKLNSRLAEVLSNQQVIDSDDLEKAFMEANKRNIPLREALLGMDIVVEDQINWAISNEKNIPFILLTDEMLDPEILNHFPLPVLRDAIAIPIPDALGDVTLVMADPLNEEAYTCVKDYCRTELHLGIGSKGRIIAALDKLAREQEIILAETPTVTFGDSAGIAGAYRMLIDARRRYASRILLRPAGDGLEAVFRMERGWVIYKAWSRRNALSIMTRCRLIAGLQTKPSAAIEKASLKTRISGERLKFDFEFNLETAGDTLSITIHRITSCATIQQINTLHESHRNSLVGLFTARRPTGIILINAADELQRHRMIYGLLATLAPQKYDMIAFGNSDYFECPETRRLEINSTIDSDLTSLVRSADVVAFPLAYPRQLADLFNFANDSLILVGLDFVSSLLAFRVALEVVETRTVVADRLRAVWSGRRVDLTCQNCGGIINHKRGIIGEDICPECDGYGRIRGTDLFEVFVLDNTLRQLISRDNWLDVINEKTEQLIIKPSIESQLREGITSGRIFNQEPNIND